MKRRRFGRLRYRLLMIWKWLVAARHFETALYRAWKESGAHNSGYAAESGIVVLPPSVRAQLKLPCLLRFVPDDRNGWGGFYMVDERAQEEGEEAES